MVFDHLCYVCNVISDRSVKHWCWFINKSRIVSLALHQLIWQNVVTSQMCWRKYLPFSIVCTFVCVLVQFGYWRKGGLWSLVFKAFFLVFNTLYFAKNMQFYFSAQPCSTISSVFYDFRRLSFFFSSKILCNTNNDFINYLEIFHDPFSAEV